MKKYQTSGQIIPLAGPMPKKEGRLLRKLLGLFLWEHPICTIEIVNSIRGCPKRLWIPRLFMTLRFIVWYIPYSVKEFRTCEEILNWEKWVPDYDEERARELPKSFKRRDEYEKLAMDKQRAKNGKV